jgi:hypothetical protein
MCVVSNVGDMGRELLPTWPYVPPVQPFFPLAPEPQPFGPFVSTPDPGAWAKEAFEAFKQLLEAARKYDKDTGQPHCEDPDKTKVVEDIKQVAEAVGPAVDKRQKEFVRDLTGLQALINGQCSLPLIMSAMEAIVKKYKASALDQNAVP